MKYLVSTGRMSNKAANQQGRMRLLVICFLAGAWVFGQGYAATDNAGDSTVPMPDPKPAGDETTQMPQAATAEPDRREEVFIQIQTRLREAEQSRDILVGEKDRLEKQLIDEQGARSKTEEALSVTQMERDRAREALSQTKKGLMETEATLSGFRSELGKMNGILRQYRDALGKTKNALIDITAERDRLAAELKQSQDEQVRMSVQLDQIQSTAGGLKNEMVDLQARLPRTLGGGASLETLEREAGKSAAELRKIQDEIRRDAGNSMSGQGDAAISALRNWQLLIASATQASGVYRLQPGDTLGKTAQRFYGTNLKWRRIYEANQHILDNPDRVIPDLTLVIP